ncbi:MAG: hypothetical protein JST16_12295 [Bdellovibrionales bacterium]|nr:hypothetical protein [Bdellovibrionales bacterium]
MNKHKQRHVTLAIGLVALLGSLTLRHLHSLPPLQEQFLLRNSTTSPTDAKAPPPNATLTTTTNSEASSSPSEDFSARSEALAHKQAKISARQLAHSNLRQQPSGPSIVSGTENYQAIPGLIATQNPEPSTPVLAHIGNYRIVESNENGSDLRRFTPSAPPVVARSSDGQKGIVTGIINVELRAMADASDVARIAGLDIAQESPNLGRVFLQIRTDGNIPELLTKLRGDVRVKSVELDILDSAAVAR